MSRSDGKRLEAMRTEQEHMSTKRGTLITLCKFTHTGSSWAGMMLDDRYAVGLVCAGGVQLDFACAWGESASQLVCGDPDGMGRKAVMLLDTKTRAVVDKFHTVLEAMYYWREQIHETD